MTALLLAAALAADVPAGALRITDIDGVSHDLSGRPAVLVFAKTACPVGNAYQPTLRRLAKAWGEDVPLAVLHIEGRTDAAAAKAHRAEYDVPGVVAIDAGQRLAALTGATIAPEAVVLDASGVVRYRGRIDDLFLGFGKRRQVATTRELADAVEAVRTGRPVEVSRTEAVGCRIRFAK